MTSLAPSRLRARLFLLALLSGLIALLSAATASASVTTQYGFNEWNDASNYSLQPQMNMPIRRMLVGWNQVQPTPTTWDFSKIDAIYSALLGHGLKPSIVVQSAPCWANPSQPCNVGTLPPDPAHYSAWSTFIRKLAARYPAAIGIEIWNEPNLPGEWMPRADPVAYTAVLKAAYKAVKSVNKAEPVVSAGLFASPPVVGGYGDSQFLSAMYAHGAKGYMNGIGIHPYPVTSGSTPTFDVSVTEQTLSRVRAARDAAGDGATPLWVTEVGESTTSSSGGPAGVTETQQANDLLTILSELQTDGDVQVALVHDLVDYAGYPSGYGVFNSDDTPKLAACYLSLHFHGTLNCPGVTLPTTTTSTTTTSTTTTVAATAAAGTPHAVSAARHSAARVRRCSARRHGRRTACTTAHRRHHHRRHRRSTHR